MVFKINALGHAFTKMLGFMKRKVAISLNFDYALFKKVNLFEKVV